MNANDTTLLELVTKVLDDNKAENIVTIDLKGKTSIANYMVIASGTSNPPCRLPCGQVKI